MTVMVGFHPSQPTGGDESIHGGFCGDMAGGGGGGRMHEKATEEGE
jgi:hypothetical protein